MNPLFQPSRAEWFRTWAEKYRQRADALEAPRHSPAVEQWREPVERYWGLIVGKELLGYQGFWLDVEGALKMIWCESRGNPAAINATSQASGLFQHLPDYYDYRVRMAAKECAGDPGVWLTNPALASIFDPEPNIAAAAWLRSQRGWQPWAPYSSGKWQPYTLTTYWDGAKYV